MGWIQLTLRQATALVEFFGGSDTEVTIEDLAAGQLKDEDGGELPAGIYAWCSDYPEEGAAYLGPTEVQEDDDTPPPPAFDLIAHLHRQREFSLRTFGPGARVNGVTDHIAKELVEVRESGGDLKEWIDVVILGLDGAWRSGATPEQIVAALLEKQTKNERRTWPNWRTADPGKAIEHVRGDHP